MTVSQDDINAMLNEEMLARRTKVMFLRNAGATWDAIAKETGVSEGTCRKDYQVVCRDINNEQPAFVIARHRAVIFDVQRANYPAMMKGDKDAAATILRALDREAKLLGLDAPTRVLAAASAEDFANEAARLITRIQQLDPDTLKELERARHQEADALVIDAEVASAEADGDPRDAQPPHGAEAQPGDPRVLVAVDPSAAAEADGPRSGSPAPPALDADDDDDWSNI